MTDGCDRSWAIDEYRGRRLGQKDHDSFERHLRFCQACTSELRARNALRELGRRAPPDEPSELLLRRLRVRVLRDAALGAPPARLAARPAGLAAAALVAVTAAIALVHFASSGGEAPAKVARATHLAPGPQTSLAVCGSAALAGSVVGSTDARWTQSREQGVERVALGDGTLHVHVRHQAMGERFLVVLPDGELEVRGTTFDVSVVQGSTTRVHVDEGLVELRLGGRGVTRLGAGQEWTAGAPAGKAAAGATNAGAGGPIPSRAAAPAPGSPAGARTTEPARPGDELQDYAAAMELLRLGRNEDAANAFHAFATRAPDSSQAEDASFLEAVALARAGRTDAAALAAQHHLTRFPSSFHRKEAALLVARAAVQRGDCAEARAVLAPWRGAVPDPEARGALRSPCDGP